MIVLCIRVTPRLHSRYVASAEAMVNTPFTIVATATFAEVSQAN